MNNERISRRINNGDFHVIGLISLLSSYFILPVIMVTALTFAVQQLYPGIIDEMIENQLKSQNYQTLMIFAQVISEIPIAILLIYFTRKILVIDFKKFKKNFVRDFGIIIVGAIALFVLTALVTIIYQLLEIDGVSQNEETIQSLLKNEYAWLMLVATVLFAPIIEEFMFRKFLMGTFEEKFHWSPILSIIASSILFSLVHVLQSGDLIYIFQYIPLAAVICFTYHYSNNNIYVPMSIHFINNLIASLGALLIQEMVLF